MRLPDFASDDANFLSRVTTSDESWIYGYDPGTKQQSSELKSPKAHSLKSETGEEQSQELAIPLL
jgi:hypothetical protein